MGSPAIVRVLGDAFGFPCVEHGMAIERERARPDRAAARALQPALRKVITERSQK